MTPTRRVTTFRVDADLLDAMDALRVRDGIPYSEQIRRALRPWLERKGVLPTRARRPAASPARARD